MTDIQVDIMEIKQTLKAMQADIEIIKRYNNIYDWQAFQYPKSVPLTQGCNYEQQQKSMEEWENYCKMNDYTWETK